MKKILMPVEKFQEDYKIIDEAVEIGKKFDSTITLFYVDDSKIVLNRLQADSYEDIEKIMASQKIEDSSIENIAGKYKEKGLKIQTKEIVGDPAAEILKEAEDGDYDLVIMKTHGMGPTKRFMLGSVTNKVVHHIKKPILVVR